MQKRILAVGVLVVAFVISYAVVAYGQSAPADGSGAAPSVSYPIAELSGCGSQTACRSYCEDPSHIQACIEFGKSHGLMSQDEAQHAEKFSELLDQGGGPGGCRTPEGCRTYCEDITHVNECVKFAKDAGVNDENVQTGEKIQTYLKNGGRMPGGCTSRQSCEKYCGDFSHAKECFEFAQAAGIPQGGPGGPDEDQPTPEQMKKFMELTAAGQTPGGCTSKDTCETYCKDESHREECTAFAEKAGFIRHDEAQRMSRLGGRGPGGCTSASACRAFCSQDANRQACYEFGRENGLISQNDLNNINNGLIQLRAGLNQAPPEVLSCINDSVGADTVAKIQSGSFTPGPEIGDTLRACFEKGGKSMGAQGAFSEMPEAVRSCVKDKMGDNFEKIMSGKMTPTPGMADAVRICFGQQQMFEGGGPGGGAGPMGGSGPGGPSPAQFLRTAPPEVTECLKARGIDTSSLDAPAMGDAGIRDKVKSCFESFRPGQPAGSVMGAPHNIPGPGNQPENGGPGAATECIHGALGESVDITALDTRDLSADAQEKIKNCFKNTGTGGSGVMPQRPMPPQPGFQNGENGSGTYPYPMPPQFSSSGTVPGAPRGEFPSGPGPMPQAAPPYYGGGPPSYASGTYPVNPKGGGFQTPPPMNSNQPAMPNQPGAPYPPPGTEPQLYPAPSSGVMPPPPAPVPSTHSSILQTLAPFVKLLQALVP